MWYGNNERRAAPARFIRALGSERIAARCYFSFVPDALGGGRGQPVFGDRYRVLSKDAAKWQSAVLDAAAESGRLLPIRKIGSAGKYSFWVIDAQSPAEAMAASERLESEARAAEDDVTARALASSPLKEGEAFVTSSGERLPAVAACRPLSQIYGIWEVLLQDGTLMRNVRGAIHSQDGTEQGTDGPNGSRWLPYETGGGYDTGRLWAIEAAIAAAEDAERAAAERAAVVEAARIEAARAAKRAAKAAKRAPQQAASEAASRFAAVAAILRK